MNIDRLLHRYFGENGNPPPVIEVFDNATIYNVYNDIVRLLNSYPEVELTVLQGLSYCFYEVLDNVLTHSEKICGTVIMRYIAELCKIQILVVDDGIGIQKSLQMNPQYIKYTEKEAIASCILDKVTDGKGMGFGLYSTSRLIQNVGIVLKIHSGNCIMSFDGQKTIVENTEFWQGTIVYFEIHSDREINPNDIVENRTDCVSQYNEEFIDTDEIENLW